MVFDLVEDREAERIASKAEIEELNTYSDNLAYYREQNFSYIPLPSEKEYFDVDRDQLKDMSEEQFLPDDTHLITAMALLRNHPFLLIDYHGLLSDQTDLTEKFGIQRDESERYGIITLADLNTRLVKEMLYPAVAKFEYTLAQALKSHYPDSDPPENSVGDKAEERWEDAKERDVETHIVEHMQLSEITNAIKDTERLRNKCGFGSKRKFKNATGGLIELRHQVMHPPRPMIRDRNELDTVLDRLGRIYGITNRLHNSTI